jgi:hypothetical protein
MNKKYELTSETKMIDGHTVYRIKALKSFKTIIDRRVNKGNLGGWVQSKRNLAQDGKCWLFDDAAGYENSRRTGNSVGYENSRQYGCSKQFGDSRQSGDSRQYGNSMQYDNSRQLGASQQYGHSRQFGNSWQYGGSQQSGYSRQYGNSSQYDNSMQSGYSRQYEASQQSGDSRQYGNSQQCGNSHHCTGEDDGTRKLLYIGPCGEMSRTITIQPDNTIVAGCFHGNFDEFKLAVAKKYGENYGTYSAGVAAIQAVLRSRKKGRPRSCRKPSDTES